MLNGVLLAGTYLGVGFIGEEVALADLAMLHLLTLPYLLACSALGLLASVAFDTARRAQVVGAGGVFGMFLVDAVTFETDYEWVGDFAFPRYLDTAEILVEGDVDWGGAALLLAATVLLVVLAAEYFERKDIQ